MEEKTVFIVAHGDKGSGSNPSLTKKGRVQIMQLPIPPDVKLLIAGTGTRFYHTLACVIGVLKRYNGGNPINIPMKFSPLCGSADSGERSETGFKVLLADGIPLEAGEYIGLIGTPGVNLPVWVRTLPDKTLLVAGREFLGALGYNEGKPGCLYAYNGLEVTPIA